MKTVKSIVFAFSSGSWVDLRGDEVPRIRTQRRDQLAASSALAKPRIGMLIGKIVHGLRVRPGSVVRRSGRNLPRAILILYGNQYDRGGVGDENRTRSEFEVKVRAGAPFIH